MLNYFSVDCRKVDYKISVAGYQERGKDGILRCTELYENSLTWGMERRQMSSFLQM